MYGKDKDSRKTLASRQGELSFHNNKKISSSEDRNGNIMQL